MKNISYLLVGIIIGAAAYSFFLPSDKKDSQVVDLEEMEVNDKELVMALAADSTVSPDRGKFITAQEAFNRSKKAKIWADSLKNKKKVKISKSYSFGINRVKELIANIDTLNRYQTNPDSIITGVRVHLSLRDTTIKKKKRRYTDVYLAPVLRNGGNYIKVGQKFNASYVTNDRGLILNQSNPCPEYCDGN